MLVGPGHPDLPDERSRSPGTAAGPALSLLRYDEVLASSPSWSAAPMPASQLRQEVNVRNARKNSLRGVRAGSAPRRGEATRGRAFLAVDFVIYRLAGYSHLALRRR